MGSFNCPLGRRAAGTTGASLTEVMKLGLAKGET
jgi:hypothetical protein